MPDRRSLLVQRILGFAALAVIALYLLNGYLRLPFVPPLFILTMAGLAGYVIWMQIASKPSRNKTRRGLLPAALWATAIVLLLTVLAVAINLMR